MRARLFLLFALLTLVLSLRSQEVQSSSSQQTIPGEQTIYLPLIVDTFSCDAVDEIPQSECRALEEIYYDTNARYRGGQGWYSNGDWFSNTFPCSWSFIVCEAGHVIGLDFYINNLTGGLPEAIADLPELRFLNLSFNQLTTLPPEIGNLSSLQVLELDANELTTLPPEIGNLSSLQALNLSFNQLTTLLPEIGNLTSLQVLELWGNQLTTLPPEVGNLSSLQVLELQANQLTTLLPEIGNLSSLQVLALWGNQLTTLPPEIGNLSSLQELYLSHNQLTTLPPEIGNLSSLQRLTLSYNQLTTLPIEITGLRPSYFEVRINYLVSLTNQQLIAWLDTYDPNWRWTQMYP